MYFAKRMFEIGTGARFYCCLYDMIANQDGQKLMIHIVDQIMIPSI